MVDTNLLVAPFGSSPPFRLALQLEPLMQRLSVILQGQNANKILVALTHGCCYDARSIGIDRDSILSELQCFKNAVVSTNAYA